MNYAYTKVPNGYGGRSWLRTNIRLIGVLACCLCLLLLVAIDSEHRETVTRHVLGFVGSTQPVVFAIIMHGLGSAEEGHIFLKSAMMHTSVPLEFHIITDQEGQSFLEERLRLVTHPVHDIRFVFYPLTRKAMEHRLDRTGVPNDQGELKGIMRTNHPGGLGGMMKLFLHEILPTSVRRVIFVDTDAIIIRDPALMWRQFDKFTSETAVAIPTHEGSERPDVKADWLGASRVCSCVLLLDLERMRQEVFMTSTLFPAGMRRRALSAVATHELWGEPMGQDGKYYSEVGLGDQGYWYALKLYAPRLFQHLALGWEVTTCLWDQYNVGLQGPDNMTVAEHIASQTHLDMTPDEGSLLIPYLLHFNCLGRDQFFDEANWNDTRRHHVQLWGPTVMHHARFKYVWLNAGDGTATMSLETQQDLRFWDERLGNREIAEGYD